MAATSIRLIFCNPSVDPNDITKALGIEPTSKIVKDEAAHSVGKWELMRPTENSHPDVEGLLSDWVTFLEQLQPQLTTLHDKGYGGYLDIRVYENDVCIEPDLLGRLAATGTAMSVWFNPPEPENWIEPAAAAEIIIPGPSWYCQQDEDHFFQWLQSIDGVMDVRGELTNLRLYLATPSLSDSALRDMIGLFFRYEVPMSVLRSQLTAANEHWFKDGEAFWYDAVFGESAH